MKDKRFKKDKLTPEERARYDELNRITTRHMTVEEVGELCDLMVKNEDLVKLPDGKYTLPSKVN